MTAALLQVLSGHQTSVSSLDFGADSLVSADGDGKLIVWSIGTGQQKSSTSVCGVLPCHQNAMGHMLTLLRSVARCTQFSQNIKQVRINPMRPSILAAAR